MSKRLKSSFALKNETAYCTTISRIKKKTAYPEPEMKIIVR